MKCKNAHRQIHLFTELTNQERAEVLNHVNHCKECMALVESMKFVNKVIQRSVNVSIDSSNQDQMTNRIMSAIGTPEEQTLNLVEWISRYIELTKVKCSMAVMSFFLILFLGAEQFQVSLKASYNASAQNRSTGIVLNPFGFQSELTKHKQTERFKMLSSCRAPFKTTQYTAECLREKYKSF